MEAFRKTQSLIRTTTPLHGVTSLILLLAISSWCSAETIQLTLMTGDTQAATQYEFVGEEIRWVDVDGVRHALPIAELARIERQVSDALETDGAWDCRLVDGSELKLNACEIRSGEAQVELVSGVKTTLATRNIDWLRLKPLSDDSGLVEQWQAILDDRPPGDLLVVRREQEDSLSLNAVDGVVGDLTAESLAFKFDDSQIDVDLERIDSIVFYHPTGRRLPETQLRVLDRFGQTFVAREWTPGADGLKLTTVSGSELELPLDSIRLLDLEVGRVLHLSDLEPATFEWSPFIGAVSDNDHLSQLFALAKDQSFSGKPLMLYSQSGFGSTTSSLRPFARGLALRSRTRLIYRLPEDYTRLVGWLGMDPDVRPRGNVQVTISGDGRVLSELVITGLDEEPVRVDLPVSGVRRLAIEVDYGEGGDLGDRLHWADPRVVK